MGTGGQRGGGGGAGRWGWAVDGGQRGRLTVGDAPRCPGLVPSGSRSLSLCPHSALSSCPLTPSYLSQPISCPGPHHPVPSRYLALVPLSISSWSPSPYPSPHQLSPVPNGHLLPVPIPVPLSQSSPGASSQFPSPCPGPQLPILHHLSPNSQSPRGAPARRVKGHCWEGLSLILALLGRRAVWETGEGCRVTRFVASIFLCFLST